MCITVGSEALRGRPHAMHPGLLFRPHYGVSMSLAHLFASDSYWSILANAGAIAGLFVLVYVGLVRFSRTFRSFAIASPYLRRRGIALSRESRRVVTDALQLHVNGHTRSAGEVLSSLVRQHEGAHLSPWSEEVGHLRSWLAKCGRPGAPSLAARLVAPAQSDLADQFADDLRQALAAFDHVVPVSAEVAAGHHLGSRNGRVVASALSGAAVLVDASGTRGGTLDDVLVWHDNSYRDESRGWSKSTVFEPSIEELPIDDNYRLGDYNGRLLELIAASVAANPRDGATRFVVQTRETCYRATEPPSSLACKRLLADWDDVRTPEFRPLSTESTTTRDIVRASRERTCPLTSYVSLVTFAETDDQSRVRGYPPHAQDRDVEVLVLCRRSAATRNGASTLSATGGGVIELSQQGIALDTDELGRPDIAHAALRELREEIGVSATDVVMQPVAVWVATVNGRETTPHAPRGQAVGSVLFMGSSSLGVRGVRHSRHSANPSRGGFEVDDLEFIAMADGHSGLERFCAVVRELASELDQHGLLSCYYAALRKYGPRAVDAFVTAFHDAPWWALNWAEEPSCLRVCRDVRKILPLDRSELEGVSPQWAQHWQRMVQTGIGMAHAER